MLKCNKNLPLVSVIITTYNYATFLPKAIESVLGQTYGNFEIIIIDDGSTDNTKSIVKANPAVTYFYQENKGLSAARNLGFARSAGDYLVFLDADDWLQPDAIEQNFKAIQDKPDIAFVSGNYYLLRAGSNKPDQIICCVEQNHYERLLQGNYIGMHAAVMFQRWVLRQYQYDENLNACEDYDLYLRIARNHRVIHHQQFIATYYFHPAGLSHNYQLMIDSICAVMEKQRPYIATPGEQIAYNKGLAQWRDYYLLQQNKS